VTVGVGDDHLHVFQVSALRDHLCNDPGRPGNWQASCLGPIPRSPLADLEDNVSPAEASRSLDSKDVAVRGKVP
jgi:hypothetical protein